MKTYTHFLTLLIALAFPLVGHSALLNLPDKPVSGAGVDPNVYLLFDNSDIEIYNYYSYIRNDVYDSKATGTYAAYPPTFATNIYAFGGHDMNIAHNYGGGVTERYNSYIFANSDNGNGQVVPSGTKEWRHLSSSLNQLYYDPSVTYTPWPTNCSGTTPCADATFTLAKSNPYAGTAGYSVTRSLVGASYNVWINNQSYSGGYIDRAGGTYDMSMTAIAGYQSLGTPANGKIENESPCAPNCSVYTDRDLWDSYVNIAFTSTGVTVTAKNSNAVAGSGGGLTVSNASGTPVTLTTSTSCYNVLGPPSLVESIYNGTYTYSSTGAAGCQTIAQAKQNFANWYQYYRKMSLVRKNQMIYIFNTYPNVNYGLSIRPRGSANYVLYPITSNTTASLLNTVLSTDPPGPEDTGYYITQPYEAIGDNYQSGVGSGGVSPIQYSCQKNYVLIIYPNARNTSSTGMCGGTKGDVNPYASTTNCLGDAAAYYYLTDLAPSLSNYVPSAGADNAPWQHMTPLFFSWASQNQIKTALEQPAKATILQANAPNDPSLIDPLFTLINQSTGSAAPAPLAPVSQNSSVLSATSKVYQPSYNGSYWSGDVKAYSISATGVLSGTPIFSANCLLTGGTCTSPAGTNTAPVPSSRVVITRDWSGANAGVPFTFPAADNTAYATYKTYTNFINLMKYAPYVVSTTNSTGMTNNRNYGTALVNYIRGDRTQELAANATYDFRDRTTLLGDIIDSSPIYVGPPSRGYPDTIESVTYSSFKTSKAARTPMLYVGANDGMLHGFDAATGVEKLAYVPGARQIYANLAEFAQQNYPHYFFVNATPAEGDAFYSGAWHTILATTLGNGGQSLSILDITDPANFTAANASTIYESEFNDTNDADLGYVPGTPIIAKVRSGAGVSKWAIIMGNGYNNSEADGYASTTGKAALYILFIEAGLTGGWVADTSYIKIPVGTGTVATPSGLATPFAIDTDGDNVVDYVYAGDLQGNMWRFNLTSTTPTAWKTAATKLYAASFSVAGDQPITSAPYVKAHPTGIANGLMVYFGTGKFLEPADNSRTGQVTQAFYGIWDKMAGATVLESSLLQQQILGTATVGSNSFRLVTNNSIVWTTNSGWYINLIDASVGSNNGERVISAPIYRNGNIVFSTLIPNTDPCASPLSWLMELDATSGGRPSATPFDVNNDGVFSSPDYITVGAVTGPASGILPTVGAFLMPTVFTTTDLSKEVKVLNGTGGMGTVNENPGGVAPSSGRRSWRQLN